jgi:hypothetical protein
MIKYFTIFGERCSGTTFLMNAIQTNFNLIFTAEYTWKHFFGHYDFSTLSDVNNNETLFIGIIREPIEWINSFFLKKHHIPFENKKDINSFLFNTFYSIRDDNSEILEDRHIITKKRYKNIFELRKIKNNYLIHEMKNKVKNYILIRYEDLRDMYITVLDFLHTKFNLIKKFNKYITIDSYKGIKNYPFIKKHVTLKPDIIKLIKNNIDIEQENTIGYLY